MNRIQILFNLVLVYTTIFVSGQSVSTPEKYDEFLPQAEKLLSRTPVIDGHNDFPTKLRRFVSNDLTKVNFSSDLTKDGPWSNSFTDIPRLRKGKVGGQFWAAYTYCGSNEHSLPQTIETIDVIKRLVKEYSNDLQFATSAADIENAIANKKIASLIGIEGGHSIQDSIGCLQMFYNQGARYLTLTHDCNTAWAEAATYGDSATSNGLSDFGLEIVDEMNRLGMMVDLSHVSQATMKAALDRSKAPVIFSHSSARAVCDHQRNVPDDVLLKVKENNGLVMVNFYRGFIQCDSRKKATIWEVVGIGADYDGIPEAVQGLEDVSKYPSLFAALLATGNWQEEELVKLSGSNLLRVMKQVETVRDSLQRKIPMQTACLPASYKTPSSNDDPRKCKEVPAQGAPKLETPFGLILILTFNLIINTLHNTLHEN